MKEMVKNLNTIIENRNENWKFHLGECEEAWYKGFDDSQWRSVRLPHDWSVEIPFSKEYSSGTGYAAGGVGWYRLHFTLPKEYEGKCIRVVFDGIYKNSQVWCNSYYLGKRPNGYTTFSYDLTSFLCFGEEMDNEISVKVNHTDIADSRWFTGSGITRKVTFLIEEKVHPKEYGIFFQTKQMNRDAAQIEVANCIENTSDQSVTVNIETILSDACGNISLRIKDKTVLNALETKKCIMSGMVSNPKLWSPEEPNLYKMQTFYKIDDKAPYQVQEEMVGIRTICFDAQRGFFLNGIETKLKGVCIHHDGGCLGAAMVAEVWQRRLEILKDCGCNAIRCSHNPHMPELYQLCDSMGFFVMDEAFDEWENAKNKWSDGHNVYPPKHQGYFEDFPQYHEADLKAMVRRGRNHPSIILWSIGNEVDYPNDPYCHPMFETMTGNNDSNKPAAERMYDPNRPNTKRLTVLAKRLSDIVKQEDKTRPVTLAAAFPELSSKLGLLHPLDVAGYNYKEHLYADDHKEFPDKPFLGSENNHSYQAWLAVKENPYISGQFLWTGIDYLGEAQGWPVHGSPAGIITCAGYRKPEFYKRKSFWSKEDVLHISTRKDDGRTQEWIPVSDTWNYETGEMILVKCFSNLPEVKLYLNEKQAGRQNQLHDDGTFCFRIPFEPGILKAVACDASGRICLTHQLKTSDGAKKIVWDLWKGKDAITNTCWNEISARPGYLYQLEIKLMDDAGQIPVGDDRKIKIQVNGDGELAGIENGDLSDVTPYSSNERKTYNGQLMVFIRRTGIRKIYVEIESDMGIHKLEID